MIEILKHGHAAEKHLICEYELGDDPSHQIVHPTTQVSFRQ